MEEWIILAVAALLTGCIAGVLAGLFGIGGGIVIVPVMEGILTLIGVDASIRMHIAVATSLATIIPTSISSARAHHRRGAVDFDIVKRWAVFVLLGALLGTWIASQLHSRTLAIIFAVLALVVAVKMIFFPDSRNLTEDVPRGPLVLGIPISIGCISSMMGIGGGTFSVMTLTMFNKPIHKAVGTASLIGLAIAVPGAIGFIISGWGDPRLPPGSLGYVSLVGLVFIAPTTVLLAPLGAKIAHGFSARRLSMLFGAFLVIAAAKLAVAGESLQPDPPISCDSCEAWNQPQEPFHIFGNTYYVGVAGISAVLVDGGSELLLIDGGLPQSAELIVRNVRLLGFDPGDISSIVLSHAHFDHAGGIAAIQRLTGASVFSSVAGARALRAGSLPEDDPQFATHESAQVFPPVSRVNSVADGARLQVGHAGIRGIYTPGHTPGGMTWTWQSCEEDRCLSIVFADSLSAVSVPGYRFASGLGDALSGSIRTVANLDCDILLNTHPFLFDMRQKYELGREAFVDNQACERYASSSLQQLDNRLRSE